MKLTTPSGILTTSTSIKALVFPTVISDMRCSCWIQKANRTHWTLQDRIQWKHDNNRFVGDVVLLKVIHLRTHEHSADKNLGLLWESYRSVISCMFSNIDQFLDFHPPSSGQDTQ